MLYKLVLVASLGLALLGCQQDRKAGVDNIKKPNAEGKTVDLDVETPETIVVFCSDGDLVEPIRVSGTNWNKGLGKTSASILLDQASIRNFDGYTAIQVADESDARKIKSTRPLSNNRHVIVFEGGVVTNVTASFCLM